MLIIKPIGVCIYNRSFLVARDHNENFFKNVGGRVRDGESEIAALTRSLTADFAFELTTKPECIFELPPTPAVGDPGDEVVLKGYVVSAEQSTFIPQGDVAEVVWVNAQTVQEVPVTGQIRDLIIPKLQELDLID